MWQKSCLLLLFVGAVVSACGTSGSERGAALVEPAPSPTASETALPPEVRRPATAAPTQGELRDRTATPSATASPAVETVCADMADRMGTTVVCRIALAHCSYREDVSGSPTFCNDAPYPTHEFTLLVWGEDWSDFDGRCLIVTGYLSRYQGQPQIVAESRSQVSFCD